MTEVSDQRAVPESVDPESAAAALRALRDEVAEIRRRAAVSDEEIDLLQIESARPRRLWYRAGARPAQMSGRRRLIGLCGGPQMRKGPFDDREELPCLLCIELDALTRLSVARALVAPECGQMQQSHVADVDDAILAIHLSRMHLQTLCGGAEGPNARHVLPRIDGSEHQA